jgi:uncharacterized DUF497 family protein
LKYFRYNKQKYILRLSINYNFEWDLNKAKSNISKYKINFEDVASNFKDKNKISIYDEKYSLKEDRWITIGLDIKTRKNNISRRG